MVEGLGVESQQHCSELNVVFDYARGGSALRVFEGTNEGPV